ncbi:MAG: alpha/beta hydrolase fold domain-containing protein [Sphingobacteriales bacterium]|nr:MAG: alpha/beta hydrolase fold domain-containing protein [Sphingobacteriales bacterium]
MNKSFTYYLTLLVIKLKGIKNTFSKSPIDYLKLRRNDVYSPTSRFYKTNKISTFSILETKITQIENSNKTDKLLIYLHGGAFVSGPAQHHWDFLERISKKTNFNIWMCIYPKAPENKIEKISINIDQIYQKALINYKSENIILMGDSAGGTLVIALTQRLIINNISLPSKLILISPVLDATFKNEKINEIDKKDKMLSKIGVLSAKSMCSDNLNDTRISPINGEFKLFPKTYLYIAENDITFPDQLIFSSKLNIEKVDSLIKIGKEMPHIWPLLPVMKEANIALNQIIDNINE